MSRTLLSKAYLRTLHIALIFSFALFSVVVKSQSILIPGDAVFVSVNSEGNSFEISPLIALKKGTKLYLSNGTWNSNTKSIEYGAELEIQIDSLFNAGSIIHVGDNISSGVTLKGEMKLNSIEDNLYLYQKQDSLFRFIYSISWGENLPLDSRLSNEIMLPEALTTPRKNFVQLGRLPNYKYYIRNGVSGTPEMIRTMVTNAENWVGSDKNIIMRIGTNFSILKPPVVLFDQSLSTISADKDSASINVAIYEHDGSKLTVEIALDTLGSSLSNKYLDGFNNAEINFSGLIGDGIYEIKIPLSLDGTHEGLETGIFELRNLSKGNFGDFVTHTMIVSEAKTPALKMQMVSYQNEQAILIYNLDNSSVNISNWNITKGKRTYTFPSNTRIKAGAKLLIGLSSMNIPMRTDFDLIILDDKNAGLLKESGTVALYTSKHIKIDEVNIQTRSNKEVKSPISLQKQKAFTQAINTTVATETIAGKTIPLTPSWQEIATDKDFIRDNSDLKFYQWNEAKAGYFKADATTSLEVSNTMMAFFEEKDYEKLGDLFSKKKSETPGYLKISLSATDANKNGRIDALEGLNRVLNTTDLPILAGDLQQQLVSIEGFGKDVNIFVETDNGIHSLSNKKYIEPKQVFWIKLNKEIPAKTLSLQFSEPKMVEEHHLSDKEELGSFGLSLARDGVLESVFIHFKKAGDTLTTLYTLDNYTELLVPKKSYSSLVLLDGERQISSLDIDASEEREIVYPINIFSSTNGTYTLSVSKWKDVPTGFVPVLEDLVEKKEYELNPSWSLKFDYSNNLSGSQETFYNNPDISKPFKENRFVLKLVPKSKYGVVEEESELPQTLVLHQNYPNPFNPLTTISFYLPEATEVKLSVFNIVGQPVAELIYSSLAKGEHKIDWDATDIPSGMYIYQLEVGTKIMTRKMTLVK